MTIVHFLLLGLVLLAVPLALAEMLLLSMLWPPYIRATSRPGEPITLPAPGGLAPLMTAESSEVVVRWISANEIVFRRTFGFGRGRPMYQGRLLSGPDGTAQLLGGPAPALGWLPTGVAFGAFFGLTFGNGSILIALIAGGLFMLLMRYSRRVTQKFFVARGAPEIARLLNESRQ
jgi:hypothetical protein